MKNITDYIYESCGTKYNVEDLAEIDGEYLCSMYTYYINKKRCTSDEWREAGLKYAEDLLNNGEIDKDEYEDYLDHYGPEFVNMIERYLD